MAEVIRIENLSFSYGDKPVLDGVDFAVEECRATVILGPSGIGKSTLLKLMAGLPGAEPFVGPNQVDLEAMMAQMTGGGDHPH